MRQEIQFDIDATGNWFEALQRETPTTAILALIVIFRILNAMLKRELKRLA